jgi:hypothetical protein
MFSRNSISTKCNICGITSIYFLCEILKKILIENTEDIYYNTCIKLLSINIRISDVYKICEKLNNITTYQTCFYNLILTILLTTYLLKEEINSEINYKYWIVSHISATIYILIGKSKIFQFSIDSNTEYTSTRIVILSIVGIILLIGIFRNLLYYKINYQYIINYCLFYCILYLLFRFITNNIVYHFHHALICIFISYFFTDWSSQINFYMHSILLGIIVQGLNFYNLDEFSMFYISNQLFPETNKLLQIYGIFGFIWLLIFIKFYFFTKKKDDNDFFVITHEGNDFEMPLLVPTREEMLNN